MPTADAMRRACVQAQVAKDAERLSTALESFIRAALHEGSYERHAKSIIYFTRELKMLQLG